MNDISGGWTMIPDDQSASDNKLWNLYRPILNTSDFLVYLEPSIYFQAEAFLGQQKHNETQLVSPILQTQGVWLLFLFQHLTFQRFLLGMILKDFWLVHNVGIMSL